MINNAMLIITFFIQFLIFNTVIYYGLTLFSSLLYFTLLSDIQTLPRVYFFDSYATLQTNGSDSSRFFCSSSFNLSITSSNYDLPFTLSLISLSLHQIVM